MPWCEYLQTPGKPAAGRLCAGSWVPRGHGRRVTSEQCTQRTVAAWLSFMLQGWHTFRALKVSRDGLGPTAFTDGMMAHAKVS